MDVDDIIRKARGLNKPGIWKYTPGFIARRKIRRAKKVTGFNQMRRNFLDERKLNKPLEEMLAREERKRKSAENIIRENAEAYKRVKNADEALEELRKVYLTAAYLNYIGPASKSGKFDDVDKKFMRDLFSKVDINPVLEERVVNAENAMVAMGDKLDDARVRAVGAEMKNLFDFYGSLPLITYTPGGIISTTKSFNKRFREDSHKLVGRLNGDNDLHKKLAAGEAVSVDFSNGYLEFIPVEKKEGTGSRTVATAGYTPKSVVKRLFAHNIKDAVAEINKYLAGVHIGLLNADTTMGVKDGKERGK